MGAPTIIIYTPFDIFYSNKTLIEFNFSSIDRNLSVCELYGNFNSEFKINQTLKNPKNFSINSFGLNLSDGNYLWGIRCNNSNSKAAYSNNYSLIVDTKYPDISISEPKNFITTRKNIPLIFDVYDSSPMNCSYNITNFLGYSREITIPGCENSFINVPSDGDYTINLNVVDYAGHFSSVSSNFSVDSVIIIPPSSSGGGGGYVSSGFIGGSSSTIKKSANNTILLLAKIEDFIGYFGDKKTLSLNIKNNGKIFLNNCKLVSSGDYNTWLYSSQIQGIAPGQNIDYIFDINIPENLLSGNYKIDINVICDEKNSSTSFLISVPSDNERIEINDLKINKGVLNLVYDFESYKLIGKPVQISIWLVDDNKNEIKRINDNFDLTESKIQRSINISYPRGLVGVYSINIANSNDLNNFAGQSIILGKNIATGYAVLDNSSGKMVAYVIFILIIIIGLYFIVRRNRKKKMVLHRVKLKG